LPFNSTTKTAQRQRKSLINFIFTQKTRRKHINQKYNKPVKVLQKC